MQVHEQYEQLRTKNMPKAALVIGGVSEKMQIQSLRAGCGLIIATPGRLQDFIDRKLGGLAADQNAGARRSRPHAGYGISSRDPAHCGGAANTRQTLCFSATHGTVGCRTWCMSTCAIQCAWRWARC